MPLRDPNIYVCDLSFSGGGDDEGSAAANSVMHVSADGDCGLEGIGSSIGTIGGSTGARWSQILLRVPPYPSSGIELQCTGDRAIGEASTYRG
ncbi:hypothetical protein Tco_0200369 [Tanacetum coccineum]